MRLDVAQDGAGCAPTIPVRSVGFGRIVTVRDLRGADMGLSGHRKHWNMRGTPPGRQHSHRRAAIDNPHREIDQDHVWRLCARLLNRWFERALCDYTRLQAA